MLVKFHEAVVDLLNTVIRHLEENRAWYIRIRVEHPSIGCYSIQ